MPKPLKNGIKKGAPTKRQSSDPIAIAKGLSKAPRLKPGTQAPEWAAGFESAGIEVIDTEAVFIDRPPTPEEERTFEAMYRARMVALGSKGGKVSGAKRMEMPEKQRKAIARKGAAARWGKKKKPAKAKGEK